MIVQEDVGLGNYLFHIPLILAAIKLILCTPKFLLCISRFVIVEPTRWTIKFQVKSILNPCKITWELTEDNIRRNFKLRLGLSFWCYSGNRLCHVTTALNESFRHINRSEVAWISREISFLAGDRRGRAFEERLTRTLFVRSCRILSVIERTFLREWDRPNGWEWM